MLRLLNVVFWKKVVLLFGSTFKVTAFPAVARGWMRLPHSNEPPHLVRFFFLPSPLFPNSCANRDDTIKREIFYAIKIFRISSLCCC